MFKKYQYSVIYSKWPLYRFCSSQAIAQIFSYNLHPSIVQHKVICLYAQAQKNLNLLVQTQQPLLAQGLIGLEKESLRVSSRGVIAQSPHPVRLGSALTHPYITTDYAEPMLELITPPQASLGSALQFLCDLHRFVYQQLADDELLWASSMPCVLADEEAIPLAYYGSSNLSQMKTIYRRGLGYRYGRKMQVISGVHVNYSFSLDFWQVYRDLQQARQPLQGFINQQYFGLIRNLQRYGWLIPYLFGASPAVCNSFLHGKIHPLARFDDCTDYEPDGVSMRMGDIGYQNHQEDKTGIKACYDSIDTYVASLVKALTTSCPLYEKIGLLDKTGCYRQLNTCLLQIENEYYSTVRPKQVLQAGERPITALQNRGVRYVELRSLDVNTFDPLGINEEQLRFLQLLFIFCLLQPSPLIDANERHAIDANQSAVAHHGRKPQLKLQRAGEAVSMRQWGLELCQQMQPIAEILDADWPQKPYQHVLNAQRETLLDPDNTPAARMLAEMRQHKESFFQFACRLSQQHKRFFHSSPLSLNQQHYFQDLAQQSLEEQRQIEHSDHLSFAEFLTQQQKI